MRGNPFDLLLLPTLIVFFGVLQARRPLRQYRLWLAGWMAILLGFLVWAPVASGETAIVLECLRLIFLILGTLIFVGSFAPSYISLSRLLLYIGLLVIAPSITAICTTVGVTSWAVLLPCILAGQALAVWCAVDVLRKERHVLLWILLLCTAGTAALLVSLWQGNYGALTTWVLIQSFLACAVLELTGAPRRNVGTWMCSAGFFFWAGAYLGYEYLSAYPAVQHLLSGVWNAPKYLVGFGMSLSVVEADTAEIEKLSEEYRLLYESNPHPMWIFDPKTAEFLSVNDAAIHAYGYSREEFRSMTLYDIRPEDEQARLREVLGLPELPSRQFWKHRRKDGSVFEVDTAGHDVMFQGRKARFITAMDITEQERMNRELVYRAQHDPLTGLANRMLLDDRAQQALARSARDGNKVALLMVDVDRFKEINDTYGHLVGDECLKEIAKRLQSRVRDADTLARTGGEEFTVLVGGLTSARGAQAAANALLGSMTTPLSLSNNEIAVSLSIGIALYPDDGLDMETIRKRADAALYRAKRMGGGRAVLTSEQNEVESRSATDIEAALRQALVSSQLELSYQPIYNHKGHLARVEALVRGTEDYLRKAGPGVFIPVAEESGLILPLGHWVLNEACRQIAEWRRQQLPPFELAVNVSARQLVQPSFAEKVLETLDRHQLPAHLLHLELTETTLMRNFSTMVQGMQKLAEAGVFFSIDDFGTGYSSLARLSELPISTVKIDRSFIQKLTESAAAVGIVRAIVHMSRHLNLEIVAEGVEKLEHIRILRELGCDLFQGFYLAKPLPAAALPEHIRAEAEHLVAFEAIRNSGVHNVAKVAPSGSTARPERSSSGQRTQP